MSEGAATALAGTALAAAVVLGLGPVPELGFVLQAFGIGERSDWLPPTAPGAWESAPTRG